MNENQKRAIEKTSGPCIILAGAGTGKTYTITEKIKHLIDSSTYEPEKIVCLTFSNEAANSLRSRLLPSLKTEKEPIIKTFHSFCAELLRKHGKKVEINNNFKILLPDDAKILLHKYMQLDPSSCHKYINEIGTAKDIGITESSLEDLIARKINGRSLEEMEKDLENLRFQLQTIYLAKSKEEKNSLKEKISHLEKIIKAKKLCQTWKAYEKIKTKQNLQDYSDLSRKALSLVEKNPEIAQEYDYVIVDEFQDTNKVQCDFLEKLAPHKNITIVGDLNQSIYRFRGAYKENLDKFKERFNVSNAEIFNLDKSFRSTNKILRVAYQLIQNNYKNLEECFPVYNHLDEEGENLKIYELKNNREETRKVIEIIKSEIDRGTKPEEICILFRTHQQSRMLKNSLEYEKIPFTSVTKKSLLKTTPIKITLDILSILNKLKNKSKGADRNWWDLIHNLSFSEQDKIVLGRFIKQRKDDESLSISFINKTQEINLSEKGRGLLNLIISRIKHLTQFLNENIPELILKIYESMGLSSEEEQKENLLILQKFHSLSQEYSEIDSPDLSSFLRHLEIIENLNLDIEAPSSDNSGVRIMTKHATKGLEYEVVIVTNLAQKRFPMEKQSNFIIPEKLNPEIAEILKEVPEESETNTIHEYESENQITDERRLCYVAFTRAKKRLYVTYAKSYGNRSFYPSQFLNEISYKSNKDIDFKIDNENKYIEPKPFSTSEKTLRQADNQRLNVRNISFSPSALQLFTECQKRYEYKYVYNMPEPTPVSWEALKIGSFCHLVFENGVKANYKTEKEFIDLSKNLAMQEEWNFIDVEKVAPMIKIFFHRNKSKYTEKSLTECKLKACLNGLNFNGIADRIDINPNGDIEIIDYKTGESDIKPKYRNWQLGFYALASKSIGKPKVLTLDMLKKESAIEFHLDDNGNAKEIHSERTSFNLNEVRNELIETAQKILKAYDTGFKPCSSERNCPFCNEIYWDK